MMADPVHESVQSGRDRLRGLVGEVVEDDDRATGVGDGARPCRARSPAAHHPQGPVSAAQVRRLGG